MTKDTISLGVRLRLSGMMFLQYMLFAAFWVPLAAYLSGGLRVTGAQMGLILNTMALGCLTSPIIGSIADRYFSSEKVLAVLNLLGGVLLVVAAMQTNGTMFFVAMLAFMLCYMPTWGLTNSIAMTNSPSEKFPQIRVFGSIGWVAAAIFSVVGLSLFNVKIDGTVIPLYCAAGTSIVAAVLALTLPHTPPPAKGQKASIVDVLGLKAAYLMKDLNFLIFIVISTLVLIPFSIYFSYGSLFLHDMGFKLITLTMNLGQFAEMFFMILIPLALARMGIKWALAIGLVALLVRYLAFLGGGVYDQTWLYFIAIIVHGVIFGFFFVGGQIYVDRKAPQQIRAQAQGFLFLVTFSIGMFVGNAFNAELINRNSTVVVPVAESFESPAGLAFSSDMITVPNATASDVRLYDRLLNDTEIAVLAADEKRAENLRSEAKKKDIAVELEKNLVHKGSLTDLAGQTAPEKWTFVANFALPEKKEGADIKGTLFQVGEGDRAIELVLKDGMLVLTAGDQRIAARTVTVPFGKSDDGKDQPIQVAGTFDGKQISLFANGAAYRMYDWTPIWLFTTICSAVLLVAFVLLFHDNLKDEGDEEEKPADDAG